MIGETAFRTHRAGELSRAQVEQTVSVAGWVHQVRNHGGVCFLDLRDHTGIVQCVIDIDNPGHALVSNVALESVVRATGLLLRRSPGRVNARHETGDVEVAIAQFEVLSRAGPLPFSLHSTQVPEELRLRHRFLDLRRPSLHANIVLRSHVIGSLRRRMEERGFLDLQTPILGASSPEGARDYLVPSRVHAGKFYALPQAPQIWKQLFMAAGFDRYYQVAPCFRDEDARRDRSPGEFYQLDIEMSFVSQDDVFSAIEPVLHGVFAEFSTRAVTAPPFPRIAYRDAIERYGTDKPDLRNPLTMVDVSTLLGRAPFTGGAEETVKALVVPGGAGQSRSWFERGFACCREPAVRAAGYVTCERPARGTLAKALTTGEAEALRAAVNGSSADAIVVLAGGRHGVARAGGQLRTWLGEQLGLIEEGAFRLCWVVDFPFYERDPASGHIVFAHNPFSMPHGGLSGLDTEDPTTVLAHQYDVVCNGVELSSGAIRNHDPATMLRAFAIAGYPAETVEARFGALLRAFRLGAPPHGGLAPGIDRMVMLLANEENLREVIAFPMTQNAEDLVTGAPTTASPAQLRELHLTIDDQ